RCKDVDDSEIHLSEVLRLSVLLLERAEDAISERAVEVAGGGLLFSCEFLRRTDAGENQRKDAVHETRMLIDLSNIPIKRQVASGYASRSARGVEHEFEQTVESFLARLADGLKTADQIKCVEVTRSLIVMPDGREHFGNGFKLARRPQ